MLRQEADQMDCVLKINAGAGGTEAQDWASMLMRMYMRYAEQNGYKLAISNLQDGDEAGIKTKEGVQVTPSGLQYKVIKQGKGAVPTATDKVSVHYRGTLIDGTEFDSSYKRNKPTEFAANQVIKGWTEALTMMPVGSKWELYIPQELAYGSRNQGQIKPFSTLIFEVELLDIVK